MGSLLNIPRLYLLVLAIALFLFAMSLGPGPFVHPDDGFHPGIQHQFFSQLCHQMPDRSFFLDGKPMAVCARCFGIYSVLPALLLVLPFATFRKSIKKKWAVRILVFVILIIGMDFLGDFIGLWANTHISRYITGAMLAAAIVGLIGKDLLKTQKP